MTTALRRRQALRRRHVAEAMEICSEDRDLKKIRLGSPKKDGERRRKNSKDAQMNRKTGPTAWTEALITATGK